MKGKVKSKIGKGARNNGRVKATGAKKEAKGRKIERK